MDIDHSEVPDGEGREKEAQHQEYAVGPTLSSHLPGIHNEPKSNKEITADIEKAEADFRKEKADKAQEAQRAQGATAQGANGQAKTDEPAEKPKDLKSAVANTIAEHIKKGSSWSEISTAIEKEVKRFAEDRAEEKQSDEVAESRRGQTRESTARQNNQQLSKDLANLLSGQNDSQQVGNLLDLRLRSGADDRFRTR